MKNTVGSILEHPFAACMIVGAISSGVARIIGAAKDKPIPPVMSIKLAKNQPEK